MRTIFSLFLLFGCVQSLQVTSNPPLIDVPTYSLATRGDDGKTGMNILTYATPVSISPDRIWSLGLYKGTVSHENFSKRGEGVLQLLSPKHAKVVKLLGGSSGRDVDKKSECCKLGMSWISSEEDLPDLLPDCSHYLRISRVGELIDCGSHEIAICKVESMFVPKDTDESSGRKTNLNTGQLRELGIITEQGRIAT
jgi:flavin reductase (DIM6/NTAB) family NADH-FMN oxidoreductase RutF